MSDKFTKEFCQQQIAILNSRENTDPECAALCRQALREIQRLRTELERVRKGDYGLADMTRMHRDLRKAREQILILEAEVRRLNTVRLATEGDVESLYRERIAELERELAGKRKDSVRLQRLSRAASDLLVVMGEGTRKGRAIDLVPRKYTDAVEILTAMDQIEEARGEKP